MLMSIDLAGSPKQNTGISYNCEDVRVHSVKKDEEILKIIERVEPDVVGIDAPLTLPKGRASIEDNNGIHFRECDVKLKELGIRFFPITLGPMRQLVKRGMKLREKIKEMGIKAVEIYPGASLDLLGLPRKNREVVDEFLGVKTKNVDESDSAIGLFTLWMNKKGYYNSVEGIDGRILLPNPAIKLGKLIGGEFIERVHRFRLDAMVNGKREAIYMRDTGKMREYLQEENKVYFIEKEGGKMKYLLRAVRDFRRDYLVLADPHLDNQLVKLWLRGKGIKASGKGVKRRNSTFDLSWEDCVAEVKGSNMHIDDWTAAFPDVYSTRAERHFRELGELEGCRYLYFVAHFPAKYITINPEFPKLRKILLKSMEKGLKVDGLSTSIERFNGLDYVVVTGNAEIKL